MKGDPQAITHLQAQLKNELIGKVGLPNHLQSQMGSVS